MDPSEDPKDGDIRDNENSNFKMNKKARLREEAELKLAGVPNRVLNLYLVPRKLLVFDINKVLLFRQAKTSSFKIRPHAYAFIASMSERYTLAVWTSMTRKSAKPILAELFPQQYIPLLFSWYQNRCNSIPNEIIPDGKPLFLKELSQVWREFPRFNASNTILVDDTSEKCARNPEHTSIQPVPYEPFGRKSIPNFNPYIAPVPSIQSCSAVTEKHDANEIDLDDLDAEPCVEVPPLLEDPNELDLSLPDCISTEDTPRDEITEVDQPEVSLIIAEDQVQTLASVVLPTSEAVTHESADVDSAVLVVTALVESTTPELVPVEANINITEINLETVSAASDVAAPVPMFRPPPPPGPPPPQPPISTPFNPYFQDEDCELVPGGPLWNYLDQMARHDGPVQEVFERLGPYRFTY